MFIDAKFQLVITLRRSVTLDRHAPPGLAKVNRGFTKL